MNVWKKQSVKWVTNGKRVAKETKGAKQQKTFSKRFYGTLNTFTGKKKQVPLTEEKGTSQTLLRRLQTLEDEKRANGADRYSEERLRPLNELLADYQAILTSRGNSPLHVTMQTSRCHKLIAATKAKTIDELDGSRILNTLSQWRTRKAKPLNVQTSNHYLIAIKGFSRWLWQERKTSDDPLAGLRRMNAETDRKRVRRPLSLEELQRLTSVTQLDKTLHGKDWRLTGNDRAMIYTTAAFTGLRCRELGSLTKSAFDFETGTMTLEASNTKNRKKETLPLHPFLRERLKTYIATLPTSSDRLWPGSWSLTNRAGRILKRDLKRAGIAYMDSSGRYADFHSLRYTFITSLARAGAHPSKAQRLARHSTITLTMGVYTQLDANELRDALDTLPSLE